jgi:hypothetical protein
MQITPDELLTLQEHAWKHGYATARDERVKDYDARMKTTREERITAAWDSYLAGKR